MKSRSLLLVIGGITGAFATYLLWPSIGSWDASVEARQSGESAISDSTQILLRTRSNVVFATSSTFGTPELGELENRIENDPIAALLDASALTDPAERRRAVMLVGTLWARVDPQAALQAARSLPEAIQTDFLASVSSEWANLDVSRFLSYADSTADVGAVVEGLELLVASDPARIFEIAGRLPVETGSMTQGGVNPLQRTALSALADRNPELAMRHIESMLPQLNVNIVAQDVVTRFAQNDPDAALAWLESQQSRTNSHLRVVLGGIARVDFDRAFQLAAAEPTTFAFLASALANGALSDPTRTAELATGLLGEGSSLAGQVLESLAASWVRRNPDDLTNWFLTNSQSIDSALAGSIATQIATSDLDAAMSLVDRVPRAIRDTWISQIAGPYASQDPRAALDWVRQYQGQPFYEGAHSQVIVQIADSDPNLAATLLDDLSPALRSATAPRIAAAISAGDPQAAAEWAITLTDSDAASGAVSNAVSSWIQRDVESATNWALGLDGGEVRDDALLALISGSYGTNLDPRPILDEIDSEEIRRQARRTAVYRTSPNRIEIAKELLETMLDDPEDGEWARESLERIGESGN